MPRWCCSLVLHSLHLVVLVRSAFSKNRDPVMVGRVRTSWCYCPLPLLLSWYRRLALYCSQLCGTASPLPSLRPLSPSDCSPGRLLWLCAQWLTLWLCRGSMSAASGAYRALYPLSRRVPVGLEIPPWFGHTLSLCWLGLPIPLAAFFQRPTAGLRAPDSIIPCVCPGLMPLSCWLQAPSRGVRRGLWVGWLQGLVRLIALGVMFPCFPCLFTVWSGVLFPFWLHVCGGFWFVVGRLVSLTVVSIHSTQLRLGRVTGF